MNKMVRRVIAVAVAAAVVCGGVYGGLTIYKRSHTTAVNVYKVDQIGYSYDGTYADDGSSAYGTVSLDGIQNVYVSSPTTVKEVNVVEGDTVKKGDVLVTYDTTQLELEVSKAENDLDQKQLNLKFAQEDLEIAKNLSPSSSGGGGEGGGGSNGDNSGGGGNEPNPTPSKKDSELTAEDTPIRLGGSGTYADPYIYLWSTGDALTDDVLLRMFQPTGYDESTGSVPAASESTSAAFHTSQTWLGGLLRGAGFLPTAVYGSENGEEPDAENPDAGQVEEGQEETPDGESGADSSADTPEPDSTGSGTESGATESGTESGTTESGASESSASRTLDETGSTSGVNLTGCPNEVYVILEVHESDNREGTLLKRYGMHLVRVGQDVAAKLYDPDAAADSISDSSDGSADDTDAAGDTGDTGDTGDFDDTGDTDDDGDAGDVTDTDDSGDGDDSTASPSGGSSGSDSDDGSTTERVDPKGSYTAQEIADLIKTKTREVRDLTIDVRQAELTLKQQKKAAEDGTTKAEFSGTVTYAEDAQTAYENGEPCVKVSAGGGYRIPISVSELEVQNLHVGDEVTVISAEYSYDEDTSEEYTGTIRSISAYPVSGNNSDYLDSGNSNPNSSYYPCVIYVDGNDAMFQESELVTVRYGSSEDTPSLYLESAFVRTDSGGSYVYKEGSDGKLVKTYIKTKGGDSWSTAVMSGITEDDYVAFPYGTDVVDGAETSEQEDTDALYN